MVALGQISCKGTEIPLMLGKKRQKVIKTAVLGSKMQTVQILLQNFRFYAINTLYCIKKYIFCAIGCIKCDKLRGAHH